MKHSYILLHEISLDKTIIENNNDRNKVKLILSEIQDHSLDVPDPYYDNGFDNVYQMLNKACTKIANNL